MSTGRFHGVALLFAAGVALAGCAGSAQGADTPAAQVASVDTPADGGPGTVTLAAAAERRLGIELSDVATAPAGLMIPYGAVVYEPDGSSWVYAQTGPRTYRRAEITIVGIAAGQVTLSSGPPAGTKVVSLGAAELVGVETGIDGEE
jgi:hypothetical protein